MLLYNYVSNITRSIASIVIYMICKFDGVTAPTAIRVVMRKTLLCDGLIKLTFASEWIR